MHAVDTEITLIENAAGGQPPKIFRGQTVDIFHTPPTIQGSAVGFHPSKIMWFGGKPEDLTNITDVKIVGKDGSMLIDGELNKHNFEPYQVVGRTEFYVLKRGV